MDDLDNIPGFRRLDWNWHLLFSCHAKWLPHVMADCIFIRRCLMRILGCDLFALHQPFISTSYSPIEGFFFHASAQICTAFESSINQPLEIDNDRNLLKINRQKRLLQ